MTVNLSFILLHKVSGRQRQPCTPVSAAVHALYGSQSNRSHFYALSSRDMTLLSQVFRGVPQETTSKKSTLDQLISNLPSYLRSSGMHKSPSQKTGLVHPGHLCNIHKGLKKALCYEIWDIVKHEIDAINGFTNPLLMNQNLDANEAQCIRQLRQVSDMFTSNLDDWTCAAKQHGEHVSRYAFVEAQCPACMLATLGSGPEALVALLAGMIARVSSKQLGTRQKLVSRRAKFMTYWLESMQRGSRLTDEAWTFGIKMKEIWRLNKAQKVPQANSLRLATPCKAATRNPSSPTICTASLLGSFDQFPYERSLLTRSSTSEVTGSSAIRFDISDSFDPTSARSQSEAVDSHLLVRSIVDVDMSRPFDSTSDRTSSPSSIQASSSMIGFDISESFDPATASRQSQTCASTAVERLSQALHVCSETSRFVSVAIPDRASATLSDAYRSICRRPSIASSFDSDWDWDQPVSPLPAVPVVYALLRSESTDENANDWYADVSPPLTPR